MKENNINISVGERIAELRNKNKESQEQLAQVLNLTQTSISKIEKGHTKLSVEYQIKIEDHYGVKRGSLCSDKNTDTILETLKKYIHFTFKALSEGDESFLCPIITIDRAFYDYLYQFALANKEDKMPKEILDTWIKHIEKIFYETNKSNLFDNTVSFVPLPPDLINPMENRAHWKQTDLLRELNTRLFIKK